MSWMAKAALAAALLNCGLLNVSAQDTSNNGQWLKDGNCSLFSAGAGPGDTVQWTGACVGGYAEGLGTATFSHDSQTQSFTAYFVHGVIPDGHVITVEDDTSRRIALAVRGGFDRTAGVLVASMRLRACLAPLPDLAAPGREVRGCWPEFD